jgi:hypothetical protein
MKYVKQRSENDCAIAALAMACEWDYDRVAAGLVIAQGLAISLAEAIRPEGANDDITKAWLRLNGWAWQEKTRNVWIKGAFLPLHPWPPQPFATAHICFVEATKGWHYCAMDALGRVFDPWNQERQSLNHTDYKRVSSVLGLFKVRFKLDEAG